MKTQINKIRGLKVKPKKKKATKKSALDMLTQSLITESDVLLTKITSGTLVVGLSLAITLSLVELVTPEILFDEEKKPELVASVKLDDKKPDKKIDKKVNKKDPKKISKNNRPKSSGKAAGRGKPKAITQRGILKILATKSSQQGRTAYTLSSAKFAKDIDKVLKNVSGLQTSGVVKLSARRSAVTGGFNKGYTGGGEGTGGINLNDILGGDGPMNPKVSHKGNIKAPNANEIDIGKGTGSRSAAEVMRVVRSRTPGLRHVYNKLLKQNPGFSGKVTLKFTIAPGGEIIQISIVSSTTGFSDFDQKIMKKVKKWRFKKIKSGNTTVKIPFTFSE